MALIYHVKMLDRPQNQRFANLFGKVNFIIILLGVVLIKVNVESHNIITTFSNLKKNVHEPSNLENRTIELLNKYIQESSIDTIAFESLKMHSNPINTSYDLQILQKLFLGNISFPENSDGNVPTKPTHLTQPPFASSHGTTKLRKQLQYLSRTKKWSISRPSGFNNRLMIAEKYMVIQKI